MRVVGKISNGIGMGVRKGTVVSFVSTVFGYFLGFHPYMSFHFVKCFFVTCFRFLGGGGEGGYQLHLMHIMEVSMVYSGLAVVSVFLLL